MVVGLIVYFVYARNHSNLNEAKADGAVAREIAD